MPVNDIDADERNFERQIDAFQTSLALLRFFPDQHFRFLEAHVHNRDAHLLLALCRRLGKDTELEIGLALGLLQHPEPRTVLSTQHSALI